MLEDLARLLLDRVVAAPLPPRVRGIAVRLEDVERAHRAAVDEVERLGERQVVTDGAHRRDRSREDDPRQGLVLEGAEHEARHAHLEQVRDVGVVGVADDDVQAAILAVVGVRLVARVDDGTLQRRLETDLGLEEVGALSELETGPLALGADADAAAAGDDLTRDEERRHARDDARPRHVAAQQVVLVRAVRGALTVGVVLVQLRRAVLVVGEQRRRVPHDDLARAVVRDRVAGRRHLRRAVLGVGVVDVQARAVLEHDVGEARVDLVGQLALVRDLASDVVAALIAQRRLVAVVPPTLRRVEADVVRVGAHDEARQHHRRRPLIAGAQHAVLGLDAHDALNRHGATLVMLPGIPSARARNRGQHRRVRG